MTTIRGRSRKRLNQLSPSDSPSYIVHNPHSVAKLFGGDETRIHMGEVPAAIFNRALATLQDRLDHLERVDVSRQEVDCATIYLHSAVAFYENDTARQTVVANPVEDAIGKEGVWESPLDWADNIRPDCCWWYAEFLTRVLELKNTLGLSGDATLQAIIDYSKIISRNKYKPFREFCNFPVVLVGVIANRLEVSVAVCAGSIYVTRLLALDLSLGFLSSDNAIRLARVFKALSLCQVDLEEYYDGVRRSMRLGNSMRLLCLYPDPTCVDPSKTLPQLAYRHFLTRFGQPTSAVLDLGRGPTAMYIATLDSTDREVIVKFTARYNEIAHRIIAEAGLAPTLHFCERVVGGLYMVVMDRVDGKSVWQLRQERILLPEIVPTMVEQAVALLHKQDIVFGDLRDSNIILSGSEGPVVLVDFDWPGKDGVDRYPATLNLNTQNCWAEDVFQYGIMRKSHDLWQVDRLKALRLPPPTGLGSRPFK